MAPSATGPAAQDAIGAFAPRLVPEAAAVFARQVVAAAGPSTPARARALLFAASRLADFGIGVGLELSPEVLLHPSVIERFVCVSTLSAVTRRTVRTNLRFVSTRVLAQPSPPPVPLRRERAKAPYAENEIAAYLALADAQPTALRRRRANALICLAAGAGLVGADLRFVRGTDVVERSGGVLVGVTGRRARLVPVLARYHERLLTAATYFGEHPLVCGADPTRHNVTTPLIRSLSGGTDLPRLSVARLRASWLSHLAHQIGLRAFMDAAGISCSQRLGDLVGQIPCPDEAAMVALLGGRR